MLFRSFPTSSAATAVVLAMTFATPTRVDVPITANVVNASLCSHPMSFWNGTISLCDSQRVDHGRFDGTFRVKTSLYDDGGGDGDTGKENYILDGTAATTISQLTQMWDRVVAPWTTTTTRATTTTTTTTVASPPPMTDEEEQVTEEPSNDQPQKLWSVSMIRTFLIDQFDPQYNNQYYQTEWLDPCNMTKYDLGLPYGLFFADRFFNSTHATDLCRPVLENNQWWRSIQWFVHRIVSKLTLSSDTNDQDVNHNNNHNNPRWILRGDLRGAIQQWRSDEVEVLKAWAIERPTVLYKWYRRSNNSHGNLRGQQQQKQQQHQQQRPQKQRKSFAAKVKDVTDEKALRWWIISLLMRIAAIPSSLWHFIRFTELMWSWRYVVTDVLPMTGQVSVVLLTGITPYWLVVQLLWKSARGFHLPHKIAEWFFPQLYLYYRLGKIALLLWQLSWIVVRCHRTVRQMRQARTWGQFCRVLVSLLYQEMITALGGSLRNVLLQVGAVMFLQSVLFGSSSGGRGGNNSGNNSNYYRTTTTKTTPPAMSTAGPGLASWFGTIFVVSALVLAMGYLYKQKLFLGSNGEYYSFEQLVQVQRVMQIVHSGGPEVHYRVLALVSTATPKEIRVAYQHYEKVFHNNDNFAPDADSAYRAVVIARHHLSDVHGHTNATTGNDLWLMWWNAASSGSWLMWWRR